MFLFTHFHTYFIKNYLLVSTASILVLGAIGSANVLLITAMNPSLMWWIGLLLSVMVTMHFLVFFLAQFPPKRVIASFISGVIIQLIILVLIFLN